MDCFVPSLCKENEIVATVANSAKGFEAKFRSEIGKIRADDTKQESNSRKGLPLDPLECMLDPLAELFPEAHIKRVTLSCTSSSSTDTSETLL